jgi:hypothetical protein
MAKMKRVYSNTIGGLLCGSASTSQCKVPAGQRLIIEYVSGYVFETVSPKQTTVVSMVGVAFEKAGAHRVTLRADPARARHGPSGGIGSRGKRSRTAFASQSRCVLVSL